MINATGGEKFVSPNSMESAQRLKVGQELETRTRRQELKQRPWKSVAYRLATHGLMFSYST